MHPWLIFPAVVAVAGAALLLRALFADRSRGRPRCPRCWYDLSGSPPSRCPECGLEPRSPADLHRTRRHRPTAALGVMLIAGGIAAPAAHYRSALARAILPEYRTTAWLEIQTPAGTGSLRLQAHRFDGRPERAIVHDAGRTILIEDWTVDFEPAPRGASIPLFDLTGDSRHDLVLRSYSGGAHCCWTLHVIDFSTDPPTHHQIEAAHSGTTIVDTDLDWNAEIELADPAFCYWRVPYVASPQPRVILAFRNGAFVPAPDLMAAPPPNDASLDAALARIAANGERSQDGTFIPPPELWATMLDLLYTGHEDAAFAFFHHAWPADAPGKDAFLADFLDTLAASAYAPHLGLRCLQRRPPTAATPALPPG